MGFCTGGKSGLYLGEGRRGCSFHFGLPRMYFFPRRSSSHLDFPKESLNNTFHGSLFFLIRRGGTRGGASDGGGQPAPEAPRPQDLCVPVCPSLVISVVMVGLRGGGRVCMGPDPNPANHSNASLLRPSSSGSPFPDSALYPDPRSGR